VDPFGVAERQEPFFPMIMTNAGWTNATKGQIVLTNMHQCVVNTNTAGMNVFTATLL